MDESFAAVTDCFSAALTRAVMPRFAALCEIRIRAGLPVTAYFTDRPYFVSENGELETAASDDLLCYTDRELRSHFARLCQYSVYKHTDSISCGFVTVGGGHRVGVCGTAVKRGGEVISVTDITSLNIRAAKEFRGCGDIIFRAVDISGGMLICGTPSSGKTTLLRDMARTLSLDGMKKVCVIDERMEIAAMLSGSKGFDVGFCDVYSGYPKGAAMIMAVRTMSPEYMICDELTGENASELVTALNCGVRVIATVHCADLTELLHSRSAADILKTGAFQKIVFLSNKVPPQIKRIYDTGAILHDKDIGSYGGVSYVSDDGNDVCVEAV